MAKRRLVLAREKLGTLGPGELAGVAGGMTLPHVTCLYTSVQYTECASCGIPCWSDSTCRR